MGRRVTGRRVRRWLAGRGTGDFALAPMFGLKDVDRDELLWQAHRRLTEGNPVAARALYWAVLAAWHGNASARLGLGACFQSEGNLAEAEAAYKLVLDADPSDPFALINRAEVRLLTGRFTEASADLDAASALPPRALRRAGLLGRLAALQAIARKQVATGLFLVPSPLVGEG